MTLDGTLYALQAMGIGPNRLVGVYSSIELAAKAAEEILPQTDGYHTLELRPYKLDQTYERQFSYGDGSSGYLDQQVPALRTYVKDGFPDA